MINLANDLDVRCARACRLETTVDDRPMYMIPNHDRAWLLPPPFSSDCGWSYLLEDEIERRGLGDRYIFELARICEVERTFTASWALIRAIPEQRARAFLEAVK